MRHDFTDIICQEGEVRNIRRMSGELPLRKINTVGKGGFRSVMQVRGCNV